MLNQLTEANVAYQSPTMGGASSTQYDDGSSASNYDAGPLAVQQKKDPTGNMQSNRVRYNTGIDSVQVKDYASGVKKLTVHGPGEDAYVGPEASAQRLGVDPAKVNNFVNQQSDPDQPQTMEEEDALAEMRRLAFGKKELDEDPPVPATPPQAQANKLDAAGNQISQAKQDIEAGNNFKGAFNAARGINQALDAGGATLGDKASLAWTGAKAAGSAAWAKLQGQNPQAAAADSVAKSIVSPLSGVDVKQAAATAQQYRGPNAQDITKDPQFAKLPLAKQEQVRQAQQQVRDMDDENFANVKNFDAKQTTANLASTMKEKQGDAELEEMRRIMNHRR